MARRTPEMARMLIVGKRGWLGGLRQHADDHVKRLEGKLYEMAPIGSERNPGCVAA